MKQEPQVVFCTTCKGRAQHIEQTLPKNLSDNESYRNTKFVLLDYNSPDNLISYLNSSHRQAINSGKLIVYSFPSQGPFHMTHAKNMAHRLGMIEGADILVNLDADNFTGKDFSSYVVNKFKSSSDQEIILWSKMIKGTLSRGISGRIAVTPQAFLKIGGYDERFNTWSPDDKDFHARLKLLGYSDEQIENQFLSSLPHSEKMRFKEYPEVRTSILEDQFQLTNDPNSSVVNFGSIGIGEVLRNFGLPSLSRENHAVGPLSLDPIPTRVFGIGMHKTGTTALFNAFKIFGFDSAHWKSAHWAKRVWTEMKEFNKSLTLEKSYAICDLPIPLLYKELDKAYPGSKFILTVRNEVDWLRSVKNHWDPTKNPYRTHWNKDPFTHKIHKLLYGERGFNEISFLQRYRQHNAEVKDYFKNRARDLLVIDTDKDPSWFPLCIFLKQQVPSVPYPRSFITEENARFLGAGI